MAMLVPPLQVPTFYDLYARSQHRTVEEQLKYDSERVVLTWDRTFTPFEQWFRYRRQEYVVHFNRGMSDRFVSFREWLEQRLTENEEFLRDLRQRLHIASRAF